MCDPLEIYKEAEPHRRLNEIHPLKLDRWHQGLVGLPGALYMQYGGEQLLEHVRVAVKAIKALLDVLGEGNLPLPPQEIARRQIGSFTWYVPSGAQTVPFSLTWDQKSSMWQLTCGLVEETTKMIPDFNQGPAKAIEWAAELEETDS